MMRQRREPRWGRDSAGELAGWRIGGGRSRWILALNGHRKQVRTMSWDCRALIEALPLPVVLTDAAGRVLAVNAAFEAWDRRCGGRGEGRCGQSVEQLGIAPGQGEALKQRVASLEQGVVPEWLEWEAADVESGERLHAQVWVRPIAGQRGALLLWQDDTAEVRLREDRLRAVRLEAIGQVAGNAAHEINNALSLVIGFTELMLIESPGLEFQRRMESVLYGGRQAGRVAEHLRWFARRLRAGQGELDFNALVSDCAALLRRSCEQQEVMLLEDLQAGLPQLEGPVGQFQLVILSLMQQSVERLSRGGGNGIIQVRTSAGEGLLRVEVEDDGRGMNAGQLEALFAGQAVRCQTSGYLGLGLDQCRWIARQQGGTIRASSDGDGVCVTLELPVAGPA